jgi:riboflavin synthase
MFTGIIQAVGTIQAIHDVSGEAKRLEISLPFTDADALASGESIAVNGACLTIASPPQDLKGSSTDAAEFFVSRETLAKTNLGALRVGTRVNLERSVTLATRLSGHLVQGHVDAVGRLASVTLQAETRFARFEIPSRLARYCVEKGSIALNGVSLTINALHHTTAASDFSAVEIALIPHTWEHTQFRDIQPGDPVNVEVDVLAKYVESLTQHANR